MDQLVAIRMFQRVVETGSFSAVAREFGVAQPTISKQVAALETHLGAQLLHRTSRRLSLTEPGREYYEATATVLADLEAAAQRVGRRQTSPSGLLRLALPAGFGRLHVVPLLPAFLERCPDLALDIVVSDRFIDLIEEGVDLAIRIGELRDSSLIAKRLGSSPRRTLASAAYLDRRGEPLAPDELAQHDCVVFTVGSAPRAWRYEGVDRPIELTPRGRVRANDAETVRRAVLSDLGIALAPTWLFADELAAGTVRAVMPGYQAAPMPIHAVFPATRRAPSKVRVAVDFLTETFAGIACLR